MFCSITLYEENPFTFKEENTLKNTRNDYLSEYFWAPLLRKVLFINNYLTRLKG
jgi:hypothetical protein